MGLLRFAKGLARTAVDVALLPVEVTKDAATMCGMTTDRREPYTWSRLKQIGEDLDKLPDQIER